MTEASLEPRDEGNFLTLRCAPIEITDAALATFIKQMASMTGVWGGSFDKLGEWLGN